MQGTAFSKSTGRLLLDIDCWPTRAFFSVAGGLYNPPNRNHPGLDAQITHEQRGRGVELATAGSFSRPLSPWPIPRSTWPFGQHFVGLSCLGPERHTTIQRIAQPGQVDGCWRLRSKHHRQSGPPLGQKLAQAEQHRDKACGNLPIKPCRFRGTCSSTLVSAHGSDRWERAEKITEMDETRI